MANVWEFDAEKQKEWDAWVAERPPIIQELAKQLPPNRLYLLKTSRHRVTLVAYDEPKSGLLEDCTLTVAVNGKYNSVMFNRNVFGIKPCDLEECDLPTPDELIGTLLTEPEEIDKFIDVVRATVLKQKKGGSSNRT